MNEDSPNGSPYGMLAKHDQSETKHDSVATCLGRPFPPTVIERQSSGRSCWSQQKSYAKACPCPSVNSSVMSVPLALMRSQTTNTFTPFSRNAWQLRLTTSTKRYFPSLVPLSVQTVHIVMFRIGLTIVCLLCTYVSPLSFVSG
jgi:hypothetical protein